MALWNHHVTANEREILGCLLSTNLSSKQTRGLFLSSTTTLIGPPSRVLLLDPEFLSSPVCVCDTSLMAPRVRFVLGSS